MFTRDSSPSSPGHRAFIFRLIAFFIAFGFLIIPCFEAGSGSEAREIHVARLMYQGGDYLLPLRNGIIPSKPLLFHWLSVLIASVLGFFPFWIPRVLSVIAAGGVLLCTAFSMRSVVLRCQHPYRLQKLFICLPLFILISCYGFARMALVARVDMLYSFFVMLCFYSLLEAILKEDHQRQSTPWLYWWAMSAAVLARGPLGIMVPAGSIVFLLIRYSAQPSLRKLLLRQFCYSLPGISLCLLICLPWYVFAWIEQGDAFLEKLFWFENVSRFTGGDQIVPRPWYYYFVQLFRTAHVWWLFFLIGAFQFFQRKTTWIASFMPARILYEVSFLWILFGIFFFSLSEGKRTSYLLYLYPLLSLNIGALILHYAAKDLSRTHQYLAYFRTVFLYLFLGLALLSLWLLFASEAITPLVHRKISILYQPIVAHRFYYLACALLVCFLAMLGCQSNRDSVWETRGLQSFFFCGSALMLIIIAGGFAVKYALKANQLKARQVRAFMENDSSLFVVRHFRDESFDSLLMYIDRDAFTVKPSTLRRLPCTGSPIIAYRDWYEHWKQKLGKRRHIEKLATFSQLPAFPELRKDQEFVLFRCRMKRQRKKQWEPLRNEDEWRFYGVNTTPSLQSRDREAMVRAPMITIGKL